MLLCQIFQREALLTNKNSNEIKLFSSVNRFRGSVILWRQWYMLCIFGFVNEVMFARNRPGKCDSSRVYTLRDSTRAAPGQSLMSMIALCNLKCLHRRCDHIIKSCVKRCDDGTISWTLILSSAKKLTHSRGLPHRSIAIAVTAANWRIS